MFSRSRWSSQSPPSVLGLVVSHPTWLGLLSWSCYLGAKLVAFFGKIANYNPCFGYTILMLENVQQVQMVITESPICIGTRCFPSNLVSATVIFLLLISNISGIFWENRQLQSLLWIHYSHARKCSAGPDGHHRVPHLYWDSLFPIQPG